MFICGGAFILNFKKAPHCDLSKKRPTEINQI